MFAKKSKKRKKNEKLVVNMQFENSFIPQQQVQEIQAYVHDDDHDEGTKSVEYDHDSSIEEGDRRLINYTCVRIKEINTAL